MGTRACYHYGHICKHARQAAYRDEGALARLYGHANGTAVMETRRHLLASIHIGGPVWPRLHNCRRVGEALTDRFGLSEAEISEYADDFGVTPDAVLQFLKKSLTRGILASFCSHSNHKIEPGSPVFLFGGEGKNIDTCYCRDPSCFLREIDPEAMPGRDCNLEHLLNCSTCGRMSNRWKDLALCRKAGHEIKSVQNEKALKVMTMQDDKLSHTEYAAIIMEKHHFLTTRDNEEVLYYENGIYKLDGETIIKEEAQRLVEKCTTRMRIEILNTIVVSTYVERDAFDSNPTLINLKNGIFDMTAMKLMPHSHAIPFRTQLDVSYDQRAYPKKFMRFLMEVLEDKKDRQTILEMFATALLRNTLNMEKAVMLIGEGANGKSTLLETIADVFGSDNVSGVSIHDLLWNRFSKAELDAKMLNIYGDISSKDLNYVGILKSVITGERITVEKKNKGSFRTRPYAKMFFAANRLPEVNEDTDAIYRRFLIIEFSRQFKGTDANPMLLVELTTDEEKSGILNLLIGYARIVMRNKHLTYEPTTDQVRSEWHDKSDPIMQFFSECIKETKGKYAIKKDVYAAYAKFCKERHHISTSQQMFSRRCKANGYNDYVVRKEKTTVRVWRDITIIDDGTGGSESMVNIDDFGGDNDSPGETKKDKLALSKPITEKHQKA